MKTLWSVVFAVVCSFLGAGILFLVIHSPQGEPVRLLPAPTQAPLIVHIAGAVGKPGVYSLPIGSRVMDAIQAAGGFLPDADQQSLNLAALLHDGSRISVSAIQTPSQETRAEQIQIQPTAFSPVTSDQPININTASLEELDRLPGIGPVTAQKIIAFREANGPFQQVEDIQNVPGVGPVTFERMKEFITIDG